jgi:hypothetical protein
MNNFENEIEIHGVKVNVDYYYDKGEPMVMYYADGSGHPGEPPSAEIQAVYAGGEDDIYHLLSQDVLEEIEQKLVELHE